MKLSFSLSSKPSTKPNPKPSQNFQNNGEDENNSKKSQQFVTEFDSSKALDDTSSKKFVIPPIENEWRPIKKMKNIDLPVRSSNGQDLQFEIEAPSLAESLDAGMAFGLNLRQSTKDDADADADANGGVKAQSDEQRPTRPVSVEHVLLQKFKDDLERLPEHRGLEEFDEVPVEGFGAALLAGYGWYEGRGIGKNAKGDVPAVQYERRTGKEGLGFVAEAPVRDDSKSKKKDDGGKKGREREGLKEDVHKVGKDVRIVGGRDMGCKGRIVEVLNSDSMVLKLSRSGEEVKVRVRDVADLGSEEEEKCLRKLKELKIRGSKDENGNGSRKEKIEDKRKESKRSRDGEGRGSERREDERASRVSWLSSHIRVRIISKEVKGGKLYMKKGEIVDVVGPNTCDIVMDGSRELIQGVNQELLETALPHTGGPVRVLYGKHKGIFGNLVEKDVYKETGVVRDADTKALINVKFEQIAEYIGDPSLIGY